MDKMFSKINLSSVQVIKTLQMLLQGNYTMQELVEKLNKNEPYAIFNNSVVSKYINTCRYCGIKIYKLQNRYHVVSLPFGLELTEEEADMLNDIQNIIQKSMPQKSCEIFESLVNKINHFSNKKIATIKNNEFNTSIELFEQSIALKRKVKLLFKNRDELDCIPLKISEYKDKVYFEVYTNRIRKIDIARLCGIQGLNEKFIPLMNWEQTATFTVKGNLAKCYDMRENETLIQMHPDGSKTISNRGESPEEFFVRMFRYDELCELNTPKIYRDKMKELIDETLKNYEE